MRPKEHHKEILDLLGIGIGPFNLSLAALVDPIDNIKAKFFDQKKSFSWHEGLLIFDSYLQVPFLADLVTMADPTNKFSYLNYLKAENRLYKFYCYEELKIPRIEYNRYCQWVAQQLESLNFSSYVEEVSYENECYRVLVSNNINNEKKYYFTKNLVLGVGTKPNIPNFAHKYISKDNCIHSSDFLFNKKTFQEKSSITVIGSGQSAAECFLELLKELNSSKYKLSWFTRSLGFVPMETAKLALEHFSPDYINHFYNLEASKKPPLLVSQDKWYKGISIKTLNDIFDLLYLYSIEKKHDIHIQARSDLIGIETKNNKFSLKLKHLEVGKEFDHITESIILGTGYMYEKPPCLNSLNDHILYDNQGDYIISQDYVLRTKEDNFSKIFVQNAEIHTHGISSPDLGLGAFRNSNIINNILGKTIYPVESKTIFQNFGLPKNSTTMH